MAKVALVAESVGQIQRFGALPGRANVLRIGELSLKCVAAALRFWGCFREITGWPDFPPSEEAALARPAYFSAGTTFQQYSFRD